MVSLSIDPTTQFISVTNDASPTPSVIWDNAIQAAVVEASPGPTVASRAYGVMHTAMFDAWAAYSPDAIGTQLWDNLQRPTSENTDANKIEAMSFAAYRVASELFPDQVDDFNAVMASQGFDPSNTTTDTATPAGIGNVSAEALLSFRRSDGSNQLNGYADTTGYTPSNSSPETLTNIELWTAEHVPIDDSTARLQSFLTPHWGTITPFGLGSGRDALPPAPKSFLADGVQATVDLTAQTVTLADGTVQTISQDLIGSVINPEFIAQAQEVVNISANLTDEQKLIAEFWEDGGGTSFPPGTWMTFGQAISEDNDHSVDQDANLFMALGNAVFDAGVATWDAKAFYDYARPVRAIRELGKLGLIGSQGTDAVTGETGFVIDAWSPNNGTQTILAENFLTYQTPGSDPSPPFAEYTSGHSAFSAAGAEVLSSFTGSDTFGASIDFAPGSSRFEPGVTPQATTTLEWATFSEAADEGGISRLYGGIHFTDGDINGRAIGRQAGATAWTVAQGFANAAASVGRTFLRGTTGADNIDGQAATDTTQRSLAIVGLAGKRYHHGRYG